MTAESKYKNWSKEDLSFLLDNYGKISIEKISKKINKPIGSLYYILHKEKIDLEKRWWSRDEVKTLKELYGNYSNSDLEKILSRSEDAIQQKAASLNLKKDLWWSDEEIECLREMILERLSYTKIAKILERTRSSVHNKLIEQGLTDNCRRWTEEELLEIKELAISGNNTYLDIAMKLSATPGQIAGICKYKGWRDKIKRTISYGNDKMAKLLKEMFPYYSLKQEYHIGERLRLDVFVLQLNLGFEYDGIQHFRYTPKWHKTKQEFERAKERDLRKEKLCAQHGISLIRVKYNEDLSKELLESKIQLAMDYNKTEDIKCTKDKPRIQSRGFQKGPKQKIQSRGFDKSGGTKWPKRKLRS